ncbi:hypothetical protein A2291_06805 [candidate division WOR-1 bacterium RIFOXYB2_FULL_42_35]|uniref:HTH dtxR-type domain-containing protein n=1 Tax=candidate division WOR-1 bacterium RIFOXYC2_FULL_41_25 TaxID=1802586 RepID=A0A1F4TPI7_UNCSA|nr:MAG: hypothetical protein A2291_06805 [candidate division WOR-1 bacterium RIFOXYB2_FULL_42_35]OGC24588.1 MAG: hypothetical protein A2247_06585 [candidate division WOR-1 bacterium RIFOXYA2_FULL_41_14]OGC34634.1 MAG: hypothetical protein A2462_04820 [candidate division WOR-1 bacterium RIFOXYC2_FULL_41_25]
MTNKPTSQQENYLEVISLLEKKHGHAHIKEIAKQRGIRMPSVSEALSKLKDLKFVTYEPYGTVTLTRRGRTIANKVLQRHLVLAEFLHRILGVSKKIAEDDACKIEHLINAETFTKLVTFVDSYKK